MTAVVSACPSCSIGPKETGGGDILALVKEGVAALPDRSCSRVIAKTDDGNTVIVLRGTIAEKAVAVLDSLVTRGMIEAAESEGGSTAVVLRAALIMAAIFGGPAGRPGDDIAAATRSDTPLAAAVASLRMRSGKRTPFGGVPRCVGPDASTFNVFEALPGASASSVASGARATSTFGVRPGRTPTPRA